MTTKSDTFLTNDKTKIYLEHTAGPSDTCVILIHGFSGSSAYFKHNVAALAQLHQVVAYDLRGHGQSDRTAHGHHVSRLAADLHDLLGHLRREYNIRNFVGIGCSIGAAILWSYTELYTTAAFSHFVFVDQAPLQNYAADGSWGPEMGNYGCHDAASCAWFQANLISDLTETSRGLVAGCLGYRFQPDKEADAEKDRERMFRDEDFFVNISTQCDPVWIGKLSK